MPPPLKIVSTFNKEKGLAPGEKADIIPVSGGQKLEGDRVQEYHPVTDMSPLQARLMAAAVGQSDPLSKMPNVVTGMQADMAMLQAKEMQVQTVKLPAQPVGDIYARGTRHFHIGKKKQVTIVGNHPTPGYYYVVDSEGNKWPANAKNLKSE